MLQISSKAIELLSKKLELNYKEKDVLKNEFFNKNIDAVKDDGNDLKNEKKNDGFLSRLSSLFDFAKSEKSILNDILSSFISINKSFSNVIALLMGGEVTAPEELVQDAVKIGDDSKDKKRSKKKSSGILEAIGLTLFAFSPAIIDYLKELASDPEKIKETLSKAFDWITNDLPNFFRNDLLPIINGFLDTEIIGSIKGMDILKSVGIATVLYASKGMILKLLTKALFSSVGWLLRGVFGLLLSPVGLTILAAAGIGAAIGWGLKKLWDKAVENGDKGTEEYQNERIQKENQKVESFIKSLNDSGVLARGNIKPQTVRDAFLKKDESGNPIGLNIQPGQLEIMEKKVKEIGSKPPAGDDEEKQNKIKEVLGLLNQSGVQSEAPILEDGTKAEVAGVDPRTGETVYGTTAERAKAKRAADKEFREALLAPAKEREAMATKAPEATTTAEPVGTSGTSAPEATMTAEPVGTSGTSAPEAEPVASTNETEMPPAPPAADALSATTSQAELTETPSTQIPATSEPASSLTGQTISQATTEASKPKPPRPVVIPSQRQQAPSQTTIKPGETWNINDVPDPTPNLGSLMSQLFVPETNFSGAISI